MALKQATIFKDFRISTDSTNDSVKFQKVDPETISVKNDNFATQVEIYDASDEIDFFAYKYITFDDSAVFEITDCIKNEKYTTLFIQYLSNITFDEFDENFRVDGISVRHVQDLGLDINQLLEILGNQTRPLKFPVYLSSLTDPFLYAIRLRFSEIPQNIKHGFTYKKNEIKPLGTWGGWSGGASYSNPMSPNHLKSTLEIGEDMQSDPFYSAIIPIPYDYNDANTYIGFVRETDSDFNTYRFAITTKQFLATLKSMLSDLVVSAELTILTNNNLALTYVDDEGIRRISPVEISRTVSSNKVEYNLSLDLRSHLGVEPFASADVVVPDDMTVDGKNVYGVPVFLNAKKLNPFGNIFERLNFYKVNKVTSNDSAIINTALLFLGNRIDLSKLRHDSDIYLKKNLGSIQVYTDFDRNIYQDIQTEIEYSKSAFSNYNAYKKSNIDLLNSQQNQSLKQLQKQQRSLQTFDTATGLGDTLARSAFALGTGGSGSGVGVSLGGVANAVTSEIKFNATQQNAVANQRLAQRQAHERARATIVPETLSRGDISFINSFFSIVFSSGSSECLFAIEAVVADPYILTRYALKNEIMEKLEAGQNLPSTTKVFDWYSENAPRKVYQAFIANRNPANNRKDFTIYCTD